MRLLDPALICMSWCVVMTRLLHNLQTCFKAATQHPCGVPWIENINVLQLLHSVYDLQTCTRHPMPRLSCKLAQEFIAEMKCVIDDAMLSTYKRIPRANLERWRTNSSAARFLLENWDNVFQWTRFTRNTYSSGTLPNRIASSILCHMKKCEIYHDPILLDCFCWHFVTPHFEFLQLSSVHTKTPSFAAERLLVRYFLMFCDLEDVLDGGWFVHPKFEKCVEPWIDDDLE
jgi:hypothetical protein